MAKKGPAELLWHPNFRDTSTLPDIKPVRSVFFINFGTLALALGMLAFWVFIEVQISTVSGLIRDDQKQIDFNTPQNKKLLAQSAEFEKWAKLINEIQGFVATAYKPSTFLAEVGGARVGEMTLRQMNYVYEARSEKGKGENAKSVNYSVGVIQVNGSIMGASQQATNAIEKFRANLEALPIFANRKWDKKPTIKSFERDRAMEVYTFTIIMEVRL